jgi:hypothetical protein
MIVFGMRADPEPHDLIAIAATYRTVIIINANGVD